MCLQAVTVMLYACAVWWTGGTGRDFSLNTLVYPYQWSELTSHLATTDIT